MIEITLKSLQVLLQHAILLDIEKSEKILLTVNIKNIPFIC